MICTKCHGKMNYEREFANKNDKTVFIDSHYYRCLNCGKYIFPEQIFGKNSISLYHFEDKFFTKKEYFKIKK